MLVAISCTRKALREVRRVPKGNGRAACALFEPHCKYKREERVATLSVEVLSLQWEAYGNLESFYEAIAGKYEKINCHCIVLVIEFLQRHWCANNY